MAEGDSRRKPHTMIGGIENKHCAKCDSWKALDAFQSTNDRWDGLRATCLDCSRAMTATWRENNRDHTRSYNSAWNKSHPERMAETKKVLKEKYPERERIYKHRANKKRRSTLAGALHHRVSNLVRISLKKNKHGGTFHNLVDYSRDDLQKRLNKTMPHGYTWTDFIQGRLHIDHIIPVTAFNFSSVDDLDFKRCWALSNLRLFPAADNIRKNNHLDRPFQPSLAIAG
jgi:hypothetical protein